jgi:hypothetical protein
MHCFGLSNCIWASDWPYLKARARLDYGALLKLEERRFTTDELHQLMWLTPQKVLGMSSMSSKPLSQKHVVDLNGRVSDFFHFFELFFYCIGPNISVFAHQNHGTRIALLANAPNVQVSNL